MDIDGCVGGKWLDMMYERLRFIYNVYSGVHKCSMELGHGYSYYYCLICAQIFECSVLISFLMIDGYDVWEVDVYL